MPREFKQFIEENPGARPTMNDLFQLRMRKENPDADVHCQWCLCPKSVWKASNLKTYKGNECKLFSYFFDVIWDLDNGQPFTFKVVVEKCKEHFLNDPDPITDISDWDATVKEMILEDNEIIPKTFSWE
jgi:hypothetical protein